ncbi:unnamed protein product [Paramecium octaurelia]|uniref:Transmembrane protein n=1 Tax=Paramecium octaurelia TaxID=43137 RepID=A0A8S1WU06_PAROT|nr:unnamed protein product [Paramecium octaurelia]
MRNLNTEKFFKEIYFLMHPLVSQESMKGLMIIFTILNKAQELDIINNIDQESHSEMKILSQLASYSFVINAVTDDQLILIIIGFFALHIILILVYIYFRISKSISVIIHTILHQFLLHYTLIFYIPISYSSLYFISSESVCKSSQFCDTSTQIVLIIICILNLVIALAINSLHIYFGRADSLMGDNHILMLNYSFLNNFIREICLFTCIVLKSIEILQELRFALILIKYLLTIMQTINKINAKHYALIDIVSITSSVSLLIKLSVFEYLIVLTLIWAAFFQLIDIIENYYVTLKNQGNLITLQKIEEANKLETKTQSKIVLKIIEKIHNCKKCQYPSQFVECIFRRMANKENQMNNHIVSLFCDYVSNHAPLKALIRLLLLNPNDLYYRCWQHNLAEELNKRSKQFQKEAQNKTSIKNTNEHQNSLDVQTVYNTSHSAQALFPCLIDTIQSKINFWNKLINGYQHIDQCLSESLKTAKKMLRCRSEIESRFDLVYNKLKNQQGTDIISLRIIQIYYCGIYTNQFQAFQIEKTIDELLKSERFKQDESLDNIQLVQDRLIILKSSFVSKRGELIDVNYKQMAKFLNEPEEGCKLIKHCSQLMPTYLSTVHEQLMDNYMQNGYSKLMIHGESSFFQNPAGFIEPCSINLFNFYDGKDDFILNMILTKEQCQSETILFGIDGKILGITQQFFNDAIRSNTQYSKTITTSAGRNTEITSSSTNIKDFLARQPLIQFYIPNIQSQVEELRNQICSSSNYLMNNQKSTWTFPINHSECLQQMQLILSQFKKKSQGTQKLNQNFQSYKSQTYSKYSNYTNNTQQDQYDKSEIGKQVFDQINIDNIPIVLLHPEIASSLKELIVFEDIQKQSVQLGIFYSLQFKILKYKQGSVGYFMLTIKENKLYYSQQTMGQFSSHNQTPQTVRSSIQESNEIETIQNSMKIELTSENLNQQEEIIQEIRLMNNIMHNNKDSSLVDQSGNNLSLDQTNIKLQIQLKNSERSNLYDTGRILKQSQPLFARPQQQECRFEDISQIEQDMQNIQQLQQDFDENDQDLANQRQESVSQSVKKRSNILDKVKLTQQNKENIGDFASNPSRTSTNSTSKESILIVQQLYFNKDLISPLKKISVILGLILIGMLTCEILNVFLIKDNLQQQTQQVINLVKPQNIIYYYSSVFYQFWGTELHTLNILKLSQFQYQRNIETLDGMLEYGRTYLQSFGIEVPQTAANLGVTTFDLKQVKLGKIEKELYQLQDFYSLLYETMYDMYINNKNNENPSYDELFARGIVRQNFLELIDLHNKLIIKISEDTIYQQSLVKSQFLVIMLLELFSILFFVGFQLRYWLFLDHITKSIIFLVSRLNETQALSQINKLIQIKEHLEDQSSNVWKLFNFGDIVFETSDKKFKKIILKQQDQTSNNYKSTSALYSRIQRTYYLNRINVFITFLITALWTAFLLAGYLIHMQKNENFQPSLTATLKYGQFRLNMDSLGFIAGIVKTEQLVPKNNLSFINQTYAIQLMIEYKENISPLINEVAQVILENANANNKQSRFDNILNFDICEFTDWEDMKSCDLARQDLPYFSTDPINDIVKNGVLGYTATLVKYLNSDYDYEINNLKYDTNENNLVAIQQKPFENFFLSYYCDIQNTMLEFLNLFQLDNSEIAADINNVVQIFYLGVGICLFLFILIMSLLWVYKYQMKISCLRQILVLIPSDLILTANIRSQAKEIHNWLY